MVTLEAVRVVRLGSKVAGPNRCVSMVLKHDNESKLECDTHADTTVLGEDALIIKDWSRPVTVTGFDPSLGDINCSTVSGVLGHAHWPSLDKKTLLESKAFLVIKAF